MAESTPAMNLWDYASDVWGYLNDAQSHLARTEFESLRQAAATLHIRLAPKEIQTPQGAEFVRIDKLQ